MTHPDFLHVGLVEPFVLRHPTRTSSRWSFECPWGGTLLGAAFRADGEYSSVCLSKVGDVNMAVLPYGTFGYLSTSKEGLSLLLNPSTKGFLFSEEATISVRHQPLVSIGELIELQVNSPLLHSCRSLTDAWIFIGHDGSDVKDLQ